jgi:O-antigen/teichoic acid export membrane protein
LFWVFSRCKPAWRRWRAAARELASYSVRAYGGELLLGVANQVDKVIVVAIFAPAVMGIYIVALSLSRLVTMFPSAVVTVLFPKASGRSESDVMRITSQAAGATAVAVGLMAVVLMVFGPELLVLLYGSEFGRAALAFRVLVAEAALASLVQVLAQAFMALNRPGLITWQYGSGMVVAVPLLLVLAPLWGATGAAVALLLATVVRLACTYWCFVGVMKVGAPRMLGELGLSVASLKTAMLTGLR